MDRDGIVASMEIRRDIVESYQQSLLIAHNCFLVAEIVRDIGWWLRRSTIPVNYLLSIDENRSGTSGANTQPRPAGPKWEWNGTYKVSIMSFARAHPASAERVLIKDRILSEQRRRRLCSGNKGRGPTTGVKRIGDPAW